MLVLTNNNTFVLWHTFYIKGQSNLPPIILKVPLLLLPRSLSKARPFPCVLPRRNVNKYIRRWSETRQLQEHPEGAVLLEPQNNVYKYLTHKLEYKEV